MARPSPWSLSVWADATKAVNRTPTPVSRLRDVHATEAVNVPYTYTITGRLSDSLIVNLQRGDYFELSRARSGGKTLWANGYIQTLTKSTAQPMEWQIQAVSSLWYLSRFRTAGNYWAGPGTGYADVLDLLNGKGSRAPEHQGILPPGWSAGWIDGTLATDGTLVGAGDIWHGGFEDALTDLQYELEHYAIFARETPGHTNTAYSGQIDIGPLGDSSGLTIWGGAPLLNDMQVNHSYGTEHVRPDLGTAQALGYAVITNAQRQTDYRNIRNICFIVGKGNWENSLHNIAGGPPLNGAGTIINGWTIYTPANGQTYYTKAQSNYASADGQYFTFIAKQQNDGHWDYGVVDTTSVATYGPCEYVLNERKISDAVLLTSAAIGTVNYWGQPVESFQFTIAHPLTSSDGNPTRCHPGQTVTVHYSGQVPTIVLDANGQWTTDGTTTTYIDYPGTADTRAVAQLKKVIQVDEEWTGTTFVQTITLGQHQSKDRPFNAALTRELLKRRQPSQRHTHSFTKRTLDGIPWLCSQTPLAYDSVKDHALYLNPGAIAVSDVPHEHIFSDGHIWRFKATIPDGREYLDCWIAKPVSNGTLTSPNPGGVAYAALRLAFTASPNSITNSAASCGFYTTTDGTTWTAVGMTHPSQILDGTFRITAGTDIHVTIQWLGKHLSAFIAAPDTDTADTSLVHALLASWTDASSTGSQVLNPQSLGAIGYMLHGAGAAAAIADVKADGLNERPVHRHQHYPHHPHANQWRNIRFVVTAWDGTHATVLPHVTHNPAHVVSPDGSILTNTDGTKIEWTSSPAAITGMTQGTGGKPWLVWNGESATISDGNGNSVSSKSFGALQLTKWGKHSWDNVFVVGDLSDTVDKHTHKPWLQGWHTGVHPAHGYGQAKGSSGRGAHNKHHPHKKKRRVSTLPTGGGGGGGGIAKAT